MLEQNSHNKILYIVRKTEWWAQIETCGKDTKKLYPLASELRKSMKSFLLIKENLEQLSNDFIAYFMAKVINIRMGLFGCLTYDPPGWHITKYYEKFYEENYQISANYQGK